MEPRGMKRARGGLDSYPNKEARHKRRTKWNKEDYRRDAGLMPDAAQTPQKIPETLHTFKKAWAVDQARSKLDDYRQQVDSARNLIDKLETHIRERNDSEKSRVINEMEGARSTNHFIDIMLHNLDQENSARDFSFTSRLEAIVSVRTIFDSFISNNSPAFADAKKQFDDLTDAIKNRDSETFDQIEKNLESRRSDNTYINIGMDTYREAIKKADEEAAKIAEEAQYEASERAKKNQQKQEQGKDPDSMDTD